MRYIIPQPPTKGKFSKKWGSCKQNYNDISFKYATAIKPITQ